MDLENFDTSNAESLVYEQGYLRITVLGGIKLEGLDRLRVTLKVAVVDTATPPVRHNLDLYNDTQLEKFIRKCAGKLEVGTSVVAACLAELTEQLEKYRLDRIACTEADSQIKAKVLTASEQQAATDFLTAPNLLERTNELIGKSGLIGEQTNRLLMYLIFTSRKRDQPLHVISFGASGTGKTHLQESVGKLIPPEDKIEITTLSENAFYYFGQQELKHKLILIEDLDGVDGVLYPLRELQSKKRISKSISRKNSQGQTRTVNLVVEGPVSVAGCTTKEQVYEDNANRSFLVYLDESKEQDRRIMDYQQRASAGLIDKVAESGAVSLLQDCQRLLQPITVINPYAPYLQLPEEVFKPRRSNSHYLQFIEAVTFYHQFQRSVSTDKQTGEQYIETTIEDIKAANRLLASSLLRKSDTLTGACRNHFEKLKLYLIGRKGNNGEPGSGFTNREISLKLRISIATVKRHHLELYHAGYLRYEKDKASKTHLYEVVSYEEYQQLQKQIDGVLDKAVSKLERLGGLPPAQETNEPPKPKRTRKKATTAQ